MMLGSISGAGSILGCSLTCCQLDGHRIQSPRYVYVRLEGAAPRFEPELLLKERMDRPEALFQTKAFYCRQNGLGLELLFMIPAGLVIRIGHYSATIEAGQHLIWCETLYGVIVEEGLSDADRLAPFKRLQDCFKRVATGYGISSLYQPGDHQPIFGALTGSCPSSR